MKSTTSQSRLVIAERRIGIIQERDIALLINSNPPSFIWGEAMLTSTFITNRIVSQNLDKQSPLKFITTAIPSRLSEKVGHELPLKVFGCECYVHLYPNQMNKLSSRAIKCVFVGYSNTQKGYKCYFPTGKRIIVSKDVTFNERNMFYIKNHGELDNQDVEVRLMSPTRDIEQNMSPTHILFQTPEANSEYHENAQIPNYSKTPIHSQVYTRKGINLENIPNHSKAPLYSQVYIKKAKINDSNTEKTIDKPNEESAPSKTIPNEPADEATGTSKIDQSNIGLLEKRTTPYPLSSYLTFSKLSNDYKAFLTTLHNEYIPNTSDEAMKIPH